ncbi:hypothetical protein GCM10007866_01880 [Gluconobacter albidus]|uniref:Uncharacterized protein n=1 Tax=Gluconobacter albidus TaxID=318683 RepID=A0ABQ5WW19_9PROT|nr:hypothetical protein AA3250_2774 [Gluconobacter albidus NBRC 3250]GLQ67740.1 hypothetical protein GCM10007866_01880 [Gluconobacter albidus]
MGVEPAVIGMTESGEGSDVQHGVMLLIDVLLKIMGWSGHGENGKYGNAQFPGTTW